MAGQSVTVVLNIMGKEYRIACAPEEQANLERSALELDTEMRKMRDSGKVGNAERIAVMAALNMSHELHSLKSEAPVGSQNWRAGLHRMMGKLENILEKH